jgi:hypothetical protein
MRVERYSNNSLQGLYAIFPFRYSQSFTQKIAFLFYLRDIILRYVDDCLTKRFSKRVTELNSI